MTWELALKLYITILSKGNGRNLNIQIQSIQECQVIAKRHLKNLNAQLIKVDNLYKVFFKKCEFYKV